MPTVVENCSIQRYPCSKEQGGVKDVWKVLSDLFMSFPFADDKGEY